MRLDFKNIGFLGSYRQKFSLDSPKMNVNMGHFTIPGWLYFSGLYFRNHSGQAFPGLSFNAIEFMKKSLTIFFTISVVFTVSLSFSHSSNINYGSN